MNNNLRFEINIKKYEPKAVYYPDSDYIEYMRFDTTTFYRRVDRFLTLALDMKSRNLIGFQLKGFRNFFIKEINKKKEFNDDDFIAIVKIIEVLITRFGNQLVEADDARLAYQDVLEIARADDVRFEASLLAA
jgi:hypothetical protein